MDIGGQILDALIGPGAVVPWWAWVAFAVMVSWPIVFPEGD